MFKIFGNKANEPEKEEIVKKEEEIVKKEEKNHRKKCYENRELSWLKFNERVLDEAADSNVPLCERLLFASIFQSNLDEFYMVRVGSLHDQMIFSPEAKDNKTKMTAEEQLNAIFDATKDLLFQKDIVYHEIMEELGKLGIEFIGFKEISRADAKYLEGYFKNSVLPLLSPQVIGKKQPFPFLRNKEIYAVALLGTKNNRKIGVVPCSNVLFERLIPLKSDGNKFIPVEELILHFMPKIFGKYTVESKSLIRIIRNADIDIDEAFCDEDLDYRGAMEKLIKERRKLCPVKMEYSRVLDEQVIVSLCKELKINPEQIFYSESPLDMSFVHVIRDILRNRKELFYERRIPQKSRSVDGGISMIKQICRKDILLSYPYESMEPFIRLLHEASDDERVVSIKMTLYRVAKNSQIVESLIRAAENGKEVVVLVELRARFDEENNIEWSRRLEDAGCRIIYGIDYTKVHSKLCLITYCENNEVKYITQIGTGNYNEKTSKLYTDLSLMTANEGIALEANEVFTKLCMAEVVEETHHLLVAPKCLQNKVCDFIDREIEYGRRGEPAYIGIKINSLTDKVIIDKLIEASKAGVKIELVVRGISCLIPGVTGESENIRIISIVGRYLEHSRIYIFGTPDRDNIYISSADFMTRNTVRRVEVAAPVYDREIKERIREMFGIFLRDNVKARELRADGNYCKRKFFVKPGDTMVDAQDYFLNEAYGESRKNQLYNNINH